MVDKLDRQRFSLVAVAASPLLALLWSMGSQAGADIDGEMVRLTADDLAVVARGEVVYSTNCASCHGAMLEGQPDWRTRDANGLLPAPPHDANGHTWHHADDLLFEIVKYGPGAVIGDDSYKSAMPAYEKVLSDDDIVAVLSYIKNSWPEDERGWQEEVDAAQTERALPTGKKRGLLDKLFK